MGVKMTLSEQKPILHTGYNPCDSIHRERDIMVSDISGNKISYYLSAGYSERTRCLLPMHLSIEKKE
jgi:hypothetical protein